MLQKSMKCSDIGRADVSVNDGQQRNRDIKDSVCPLLPAFAGLRPCV